jgi:hypothetical protein
MTKRKYEPTPEQQAKTEAKRAKFRELVKMMSELPEEQKQALVAKIGAIPTCAGRVLSFYNTCLVIHQLPNATMVGGFQQWLQAGRCVKKGETGLMIWIPAVRNREAISEGEANEAEMHFFMGTVFDISQTKELDVESETSSAKRSAVC